ncbi:MAG: hypothetical protein LBN31_02950 [Hungatella sp.]|jgi:hypothetical protein|nr:hypothetical protein [Hungatella sp.]
MAEKICTAEMVHGDYLEILKGCRDYPVLQEIFTKGELALYEKQLGEYLDMKVITDAYLYQVPRIVCWYEGIIPTEDFIKEYGCWK